ncbi:hypothetical protein BK658_17580 [Pseudomonas brassicacearum]|uniref:Uncharacterized protein n=1 Tax=Pseudomonas brassicacearum TaxID=930166 RepID=A0A423GNU9_9PSED|nr:hypothetical protein BK658_17580 [Pseudomonas brassicacearum]
MTNDRTTRRPEPTADRCVGFVAPRRTDSAACSTPYTGADRCTRASAHLLTDYVAQCAAKASANGGGAISSGHCSLCDQSTKSKGKQCDSHGVDLNK